MKKLLLLSLLFLPNLSFAQTAAEITEDDDKETETVTTTELPEIPTPPSMLQDSHPTSQQQPQQEILLRPLPPLGQIQPAWNNAGTQAGIYEVNYRPDQTIKLMTRVYMTTTIVLPEWEKIEYFQLGDESILNVIGRPKNNILIVKALIEGGDTNLTVIGGSGRTYIFYLRVLGVTAAKPTDLLVRVHVPESSPTTLPPAQVDSGLNVDPVSFKFNFLMYGDREIAPERVFSAGGFTYFDYGNRWEEIDIPAVYRVIDGIDTPVNVRYKNNMIIAELTGDFTLRSGKRFVCVKIKDGRNSNSSNNQFTTKGGGK